MTWVKWDQPQRDAEFHALGAQIFRERGMRLRSAISFNDARDHGGDYWLADKTLTQQLFEADTLDEIRDWLRLPKRTNA